MDPSKGKFTILFDYSIMGDTIRDETLKLHVEDILQATDLSGTALDMQPDDLYKIVSEYGQYSNSDFRLSSEMGKKYYLLHAENSKTSHPLSNDYPGMKIIAATVKDGALYLQGTADSSSTLEKVLENAVLYHRTNDPIQASDISTGDKNTWSIRFDGFDSLDALKGYMWHYGAGESFHTAYAGSWDFTFKVKIEDLAVKLAPKLRTTWEGHDLTVTALEISPYSLFLQYATDETTALRMFPPAEWKAVQTSDWIESYHPILLTMKDGSTIQVEGGSLAPKGGNLAAVPAGTVITEYEMQYAIDTVIDPAQIASVKIGNQVLSLNQ